jgi:hypothetical protein
MSCSWQPVNLGRANLRVMPLGLGSSYGVGGPPRIVTVWCWWSRATVSLMRGSLTWALRKLRTDHSDLLLLGWWNKPPPRSSRR